MSNDTIELDTEGGEKPDVDEIEIWDSPMEWISYNLSEPVVDSFDGVAEDMISLVFSTPYIETNRGLTFGQPEQEGFVDILSGDIISHGAYRAYDLVWVGEGGGFSILAILILVLGISIRGLYDMANYKGLNRSPERYSYITGFIWIVLWFPLFLALVNMTHAIMLTFSGQQGLDFGLAAGFSSMLLTSLAAGPAAPWLFLLGMLPWVILYVVMLMRGILIVGFMLFGPVLIAGKHSNLPVISRACRQGLNKSIAIVIMPLPVAPVMYVVGNFVMSGGSSLVALTGSIFMGGLGFLLLFVMWTTFKIVSPQLAGAMGSIGNVAAAGVAIGTGNGAAASSAIRAGPTAGLARWAGNKWGGRDGSRRDR